MAFCPFLIPMEAEFICWVCEKPCDELFTLEGENHLTRIHKDCVKNYKETDFKDE